MNELSKEKLKHYATHMEGPVKAMARELLALRERAEPVAWRWRQNETKPWHLTVHSDCAGEVQPLYTAPPAPVVPEGLRIALSNAGIAAPESDEALWASQQDYIQMLVTWVKDRKPFKPAPVVPDDARSRQEYEKHVRSRYQYPMLERHPEDGSPWHGEYKESARQMEWEDWQYSWNACRAAMLQGKADGTLTNEGTIAAEPVSQPYKLPEG